MANPSLKRIVTLGLVPKDPAPMRKALAAGDVEHVAKTLDVMMKKLYETDLSDAQKNKIFQDVFRFFPQDGDNDAAATIAAAQEMTDAIYGKQPNVRNKDQAAPQDTPSGPLPENAADKGVLADVPGDEAEANPERDLMLSYGMSEDDYNYLKSKMKSYPLAEMDAETAMETLQSFRAQDADAAEKAANRKKPGRKPNNQRAAAPQAPTPAAPVAPQMADAGGVVNRPGDVMSQDTIGGFSFTPLNIEDLEGVRVADVAALQTPAPRPDAVDAEIDALTALDPAASGQPPPAAIAPAPGAPEPPPSQATVTQGLLDDETPSAMDMSRLTDPEYGGIPLEQQNAARAARNAPPPPPDPFSGVDDPTGSYGSRFPFPQERSAMDMSQLSNPPVTDLIVPEPQPQSRGMEFLRAIGRFPKNHPYWTGTILGAGTLAGVAGKAAYDQSVDQEETRGVVNEQYQEALRRVQELSDFDLTIPRR